MIEDVFEELRADGFVKSGNEFSKEWLGMEESYMRCLRAKDREPSVRALINCSWRLRSVGEALSASEMGEVKRKGLKLKELANVCIGKVLSGGTDAAVVRAISLGVRGK